MSLEYKCRRFEKGWEDEGLPPAPAYGWQQKEGARRTGTSVSWQGSVVKEPHRPLRVESRSKRFEASWYTDGAVGALRPRPLAGRPGPRRWLSRPGGAWRMAGADRNPARWAGLREPGPSARKAGESFGGW